MLGKAIEVYMTALAFSPSEDSRCSQWIDSSILSTGATNWQQVMKKCGFDRIHTFLEAFVASDQATSTGSAVRGDNEMRAALGDETTLEYRTTQKIREWISNNAPYFATSLVSDIDLHSSIDGLAHPHRSLAIRYRILVKRMWFELCGTFEADCFADDQVDFKTLQAESGHADPFLDDTDGSSLSGSGSGSGSASAVSSPSFIDRVSAFNDWFAAARAPTSNIVAKSMPKYRIGTIATSFIAADDVYLSVPLSVIISSQGAYEDTLVGPLCKRLESKFNFRDDFHELLLYLVHERFVLKSESRFWPYLALLPMPDELDVPALWSTDDELIDRLGPSFILESVKQYRARLLRMYESVIKVDIITSFFPEGSLTFEIYQWATVILDSRAIWWNGKRHLVPMLDFINCREGVNGSRVHSTGLDASGENAVTRAGETSSFQCIPR